MTTPPRRWLPVSAWGTCRGRSSVATVVRAMSDHVPADRCPGCGSRLGDSPPEPVPVEASGCEPWEATLWLGAALVIALAILALSLA